LDLTGIAVLLKSIENNCDSSKGTLAIVDGFQEVVPNTIGLQQCRKMKITGQSISVFLMEIQEVKQRLPGVCPLCQKKDIVFLETCFVHQKPV